MGVITIIALLITGILCLWNFIHISNNSASAIHQIYGAMYLLISVVSFGIAAVIENLIHLVKTQKSALKASHYPAPDTTSLGDRENKPSEVKSDNIGIHYSPSQKSPQKGTVIPMRHRKP